jgi:hypothetical protein
MKALLLRALLLVDAAVLLALGVALIVAPHGVEAAFHFGDLPAAADYIAVSWGCALATMAIGYGVASADPGRHRVWIQVGIARGALECGVGTFYLSRGLMTFEQIGYGIIVAAVVTAAYVVLYPWNVAGRATV